MRAVAAIDGAARRVDAQIRVREGFAPLDARAPQQRAQARDELLEVERLADVIVGTGRESGNLLGDLGAGGQHDHRRGREAADLREQREPVRGRVT